jgi:hypothetical protein
VEARSKFQCTGRGLEVKTDIHQPCLELDGTVLSLNSAVIHAGFKHHLLGRRESVEQSIFPQNAHEVLYGGANGHDVVLRPIF